MIYVIDFIMYLYSRLGWATADQWLSGVWQPRQKRGALWR